MREKGHSLNIGYSVFSARQYKIRQRRKKYYVYKIGKDSKGNTSERYIGPLDKIVEFYCKKGLGPGLEPGTYGSTDLLELQRNKNKKRKKLHVEQFKTHYVKPNRV